MRLPGYAVPGQVIVHKSDADFNKYIHGSGTESTPLGIVATILGNLEVTETEQTKQPRWLLSIQNKFRNPYAQVPTAPTGNSKRSTSQLPQVGDIVYARVLRLGVQQATLDIIAVENKGNTAADNGVGVFSSCVGSVHPATGSGDKASELGEGYGAVIRIQDIRATERDKIRLEQQFSPGDLVRATVLSLGDENHYYLSTIRNDLGVVFAKDPQSGAQLIPLDWQNMMNPTNGAVYAPAASEAASLSRLHAATYLVICIFHCLPNSSRLRNSLCMSDPRTCFVPLLTSLTSTRKSWFPHMGEFPACPFRSNLTSLPIKNIQRWKGFLRMVQANVNGVGVASQGFIERDIHKLLRNFVNPALKNHGFEFDILRETPQLAFGTGDLVFSDAASTRTRPILVGYQHPELVINHDISILLEQTRDNGRFDRNNTHANVDVTTAIERLCETLLLNKICYGFLACKTSTYFVHLYEASHADISLRISRPVHCYEHGDALLAVLLEAKRSRASELDWPLLQVIPKSICNPDVSPLSNYEEKVQGDARWWNALKMKKQNFAIELNINKSITQDPRFTEPLCYIWQGSVIINSNANVEASFIIDAEDDSMVARSASMLQFLNQRRVACVPRFLVFGYLFHLQLLAIEACGTHLSPSDLQNPTVVEQMHSALDAIHDEGVMLEEISLRSFVIQWEEQQRDGMKPLVKILGLSRARLVRRVPDIARKSEHARLVHIIRQCVKS